MERNAIKLADICKIERGTRVTKKEIESKKSIYPVWSGGNRPLGYTDQYNTEANNIIISIAGTAGIVQFIKEKFWAIDVCAVIRPTSKKIDKRYLYHYLKAKQDSIVRMKTPGAIENLNIKNIENLKIKVPLVEEQKKIAKMLDKIEQNQEVLELILKNREEMLAALREDLIGATNGQTVRELGEHIKEINVRNKDAKIEQILSISNKYGIIPQESQFRKIVASNNTEKYKILQEEQWAYNPARINVGSIALSKRNGILSPMYVIFEIVNKNVLKNNFLKHLLKTNEMKKQIILKQQGSVRNSVNFKSLAQIKIGIPPMEQQIIIIEKLEKMEDNIKAIKLLYENRLEMLETLRNKLIV